jgi:opacity protein-like surface antigen
MTVSKSIMAGAALALGALASSGTIAIAGGEVIYGGVRQAGGTAVPVPAPVPIPEVSTGWYVRIDAAYSQGDTKKYRSTDPYVDSIRGDSYLDNFPRYGLGVGYYLNKWLRMDVTVDQRNDVTSRGTGVRSYTIPNAAGGSVGGAGLVPLGPISMRDTYSDSFISSNSTALLNAYVDLPIYSSFTPYVGGGIGFVRHQLKGRAFSKTTTCVDNVDCNPNMVDDQGVSTVNGSFSATAGGVDYALATALMAGFSYKVWDNWKIDVGYRWLHLAGTTWTGRSTNTVENLRLPDQNIHELRAGLRIDVN